MALAGAIYIGISARSHVTPVATQLTPAIDTESATPVALASATSRPVYPYSIVGGGANSAEELRRAIAGDPVVSAHYADFDLAKTKVIRLEQPKLAHVSYRIGNSVYWTRKPVVIPAGETLLSDGTHMARTRCANQVEDLAADGQPSGPVSTIEPATVDMDTPISSPGSLIRATVSSGPPPSALAGPSASAGAPAGSAGGGFGSGASGARPAAAKNSSSESPMAAGSLGALGLQADHAADPAAEVPGTLAAQHIAAGPGGPSANSLVPPSTQGSNPGFAPTDLSRAASGSPQSPGQPSNPGTGGSPQSAGQPPNTPPGTTDTTVPTAGKELTSDPAHTADVTTPPPPGGPQNETPASIPEPGTTLLLGAAAAYAARRFRKGPAPRA